VNKEALPVLCRKAALSAMSAGIIVFLEFLKPYIVGI